MQSTFTYTHIINTYTHTHGYTHKHRYTHKTYTYIQAQAHTSKEKIIITIYGLLFIFIFRGFAVSSFCVGALIAGFFGGALHTKLGRKLSIRVNTIPWIIGGILMGSAVDNAQFIIGRLIAGFSCGFGSVCIPTYIGETSTIRARGAMGTCHQ